MSIEVTGPDNAVHEFPDGTNPTVIKGVMAKVYGQPKPGQGQTAPAGPGPGANINAGRTSVSPRTPGVGESPRYEDAVGARFKEGTDTMGRAARAMGRNPLDLGADVRGAGGLLETAMAPITGGLDALSKAGYGGRDSLTPPSRVRQMGDLAETLAPLPGGKVREAETVIADASKAAGESAKLGGALKRAKAGVETQAKNLSAREQKLHDIRVQTLQKGGVDRLMQGQIKGGPARAKEAATTQGGMAQVAYVKRAKEANDSFQRGTYNQVLGDIGERYKPTGPVGNAGVNQVQKIISTRYDRLLPKLKLKVDDELVGSLDGIIERAEELRNPETATIYRSLDRTVRQQLTPGAELDGRTFKTMESELTRDIQALRKNPLHWRERELLEEYLGEIRNAAAKSSPREVAPELRRLNAAYAKLSKVNSAASRRAEAGGEFTPEDLIHVVKDEDVSPNNRRFAAGKAHMQRWADAAHQVMRRDTEGEAALGVHVPYASPHGVATAGARAVAKPVANTLAEAKFRREAIKAAQDKTRARFAKRGAPPPEAGRSGPISGSPSAPKPIGPAPKPVTTAEKIWLKAHEAEPLDLISPEELKKMSLSERIEAVQKPWIQEDEDKAFDIRNRLRAEQARRK